jgi:hypothetical protein
VITVNGIPGGQNSRDGIAEVLKGIHESEPQATAVDRTIVAARVIVRLPALDIILVRESNMGTEGVSDKCDARRSDVDPANGGIGALVTLKSETVVELLNLLSAVRPTDAVSNIFTELPDVVIREAVGGPPET